ncbi:ABC transporter ATP-binding protein [Lysinibacillus boronitolerans]|uniref:ABC transporter ATP-binding protein n=1 Tax=Lysinibacillus boronitolerans TaxID=309788 RepID=UPI0021634FD5|nr:ABC transporter ATP-binding protein [Lysinibacillus boronitolerans]MCS1391356.1 ABC transporter ATP-binding protein [Lysinibacillus boronitolerans]
MYIIQGLSKSYKNGEIINQVLKGIDLNIETGEFITILGPSGSGKSTLLNILGGLDTDFQGKVKFFDKDLATFNEKQMVKFRRDNVSFIFQEYHLLPTLTVYENVQVGQYLSVSKSSIDDILEKVGLAEHKNKYPSQLSGGQKQRVAIARAIIKNPKVIFCDEPTGALDSSTAKIIMSLLLNMNKENNITVILITHNTELANLSNKIVYVVDGEIDSVKVVENPLSLEKIVW